MSKPDSETYTLLLFGEKDLRLTENRAVEKALSLKKPIIFVHYRRPTPSVFETGWNFTKYLGQIFPHTSCDFENISCRGPFREKLYKSAVRGLARKISYLSGCENRLYVTDATPLDFVKEIFSKTDRISSVVILLRLFLADEVYDLRRFCSVNKVAFHYGFDQTMLTTSREHMSNLEEIILTRKTPKAEEIYPWIDYVETLNFWCSECWGWTSEDHVRNHWLFHRHNLGKLFKLKDEKRLRQSLDLETLSDEDEEEPGGETEALHKALAYLIYDKRELDRQPKVSDFYAYRLSAYIAFGCISPRTLVTITRIAERQKIDRSFLSAFLVKLFYREYALHKFVERTANINSLAFFGSLNSEGWETQMSIDSSYREFFFANTRNSEINAYVKQLTMTGVLSDSGVSLIVDYAVGSLRLDWRAVLAFLAYYLVDHDVVIIVDAIHQLMTPNHTKTVLDSNLLT